MRVVVVGGTGNIGTSVLAGLERERSVDSVVSIARRPGSLPFSKVEWCVADIAHDDLVSLFAGADAVVDLAFLLQPMRDEAAMRQTNVFGSRRVFDAVVEANVPALVFTSSVGAYAPAPKSRWVDEDWPIGPSGTAPYPRHKAEVEHALDELEKAHPDLRLVRLRLAVTWKREGAEQARRIYGGPFFPTQLLHPRVMQLVPDIPGLRFQCLHSDDAAEAVRLALVRDVRGAFNVAADPPLDARELARILGARVVPAPPGAATLLRAWFATMWRLRLQPLAPGWLEMVLELPIMDCSRARDELGWAAAHTPEAVVRELLDGMRSGADLDTPPLARATSGPARSREVATGVGSREP